MSKRVVKVASAFSITVGLLGLVSCGGEDEKKDFSGVIGSCTVSKTVDIAVEVEGENAKESIAYKRCDDLTYSGKLKQDPKESSQAERKSYCESVAGGKFVTTTCSKAQVSEDCGSDEQSFDSENGTFTITTQDFIYEPKDGWPEGYDVKKELCK